MAYKGMGRMSTRSKKTDQALFEKETRTVNSVYSQFAELKHNAEEMAAYASKMDRDYFTPSEDEAIRQVLITYWQLRSALFELVYELRIAYHGNRNDCLSFACLESTMLS